MSRIGSWVGIGLEFRREEEVARNSEKLETRVIHSGELKPRIEGAVNMPIFQSATFEYGGEEAYEDVRYVRLNNTPNHLVLHRKLANLEGGDAAVVTSSGMAAITTALLTVLSSGDHLLLLEGLYGGSHSFITEDLERFGISHDFIDGDRAGSWESKLRPNTRAVYAESITNPLIQVPDLRAIVDLARRKGLISIVDNTFCTPVNFRPLELGFDLCVHSGTKYLNGHSDVAAGAVVGSAELIERVKRQLGHLGGTLDPHACFLLHRGLKTLVLRLNHQNRSALEVARFLESHGAVARVNHPGLQSHPQHERAQNLFSGFGGMLSFEPKGGVEASNAFLQKLELPLIAPSLGGVETLVTLPSTTTHVGIAREERIRLGISDSLIRVSIGIEATEDIINDFCQALES